MAGSAHSATSCNNLKVFGVDNGGTVRSLIVCGPQAGEFTTQFLLPVRVERCERARHWTIVGTVKLYYRVWWERIIKAIEVTCKPQIGDSFTETVPNRGLISHSTGAGIPEGAICLEIVLNICPMNPAGVQLPSLSYRLAGTPG